MAAREGNDGRGPDNIGSIKAAPWYTLEAGEAPGTATPALLKRARDLLKEEIESRRASAGYPGVNRFQNVRISEANGGIFLELEIDNSRAAGSAQAEVVRFCTRLDSENVLVTMVRLMPANIVPEYWRGPKTETGVSSIRTFAERTPAGGSGVYRSSDLEGVVLNGDFLIEFLRANRGQFTLAGFDERMAEMQKAQGATEAAKKDKDLERAKELVERQGNELRGAAGILKKAEVRHFRSKAEIEGLKFTRNILIGAIVALTAIIALGVINPQGCQTAHDVFAGKNRDNGAQKQSGGSGRARDGSGR